MNKGENQNDALPQMVRRSTNKALAEQELRQFGEDLYRELGQGRQQLDRLMRGWSDAHERINQNLPERDRIAPALPEPLQQELNAIAGDIVKDVNAKRLSIGDAMDFHDDFLNTVGRDMGDLAPTKLIVQSGARREAFIFPWQKNRRSIEEKRAEFKKLLEEKYETKPWKAQKILDGKYYHPIELPAERVEKNFEKLGHHFHLMGGGPFRVLGDAVNFTLTYQLKKSLDLKITKLDDPSWERHVALNSFIFDANKDLALIDIEKVIMGEKSLGIIAPFLVAYVKHNLPVEAKNFFKSALMG